MHILPDVAGKDVIELGCGTAYVSAWLARQGANLVGIDNSPAQLANARRFQEEFGLRFLLIQAAAEAVPLPDEQFDLAISEYGASIWSDPYRWIPEAARLRRHGFDVEDLIEVRAPENARTRYPYVTGDWGRRWPTEEIWKVRKRA